MQRVHDGDLSLAPERLAIHQNTLFADYRKEGAPPELSQDVIVIRLSACGKQADAPGD